MGGTVHLRLSILHFKLKPCYLALAWIGGLLLGAMLSVSADKLLTSTMRAAVSGSMSISGLIAVVLLPLLLSAYAVYFSQPVLLISTVFLKAFLFAYTGIAVLISYPASGWLIQCLLMFSDALMVPFLWWVWLCATSGSRNPSLRRIVACTVWSALVGCVDITVIAPFLARLI